MILKYESGTREEFVLNEKYEVNIKSCQPYFTKWNLEGNSQMYGITPTSLNKDAIELPITLKFRGTIAQLKENLEHFFEMCEKDILDFNDNKTTKGKLWIGNYKEGAFKGGYLEGWFLVRATEPVKEWYGYSQELTFVAPYPFWIYPETKDFTPIGHGEETYDFLDYPYDYNYDYSYDLDGSRSWNVNHYAKSDFILTIFGYVENPRILINDVPYQVFTSLEAGEYLTINSREGTIVKTLNSGDIINIFDLRLKSSNIFEPIPAGRLSFAWSGAFGFSLTLLTERSEPKWVI